MLKRLWYSQGMNRLTPEARTRVISCLVEGCSIRSTVRMTGIAKKTVMRLLVEIGEVCADYQDRVCRGLRSHRLQVDEMWGFNYCKQRNVTPKIAARVPGAGDIWLWTAIDAETKLVPSFMIGPRSYQTAYDFMNDLAARIVGSVQLTTDGGHWYLDAVENAFGATIDYAMLQKHYAGGLGERTASARYSPTKFVSATTRIISGDPDERHISTSYIERQNWTVRTNMRRYTRLSNGFSRKIENHIAAVALNYFIYNFVRIHRTLRTSPAMAAGVTNKLWEVADLVALLVEAEKKAA